MEPNTPQSTSPLIPVAIIVGFAMIAVAIFFTNQGSSENTKITGTPGDSEMLAEGTPRPVDETDNILGNPNAPILMVEYSDYDCQFCKAYHQTMHQILDEYGVSGQVAWVYRQFPLVQIHPNSPKISEAALCVNDIGGNTAFWTFTDLVFDDRDIDEYTNVTKLPGYAEAAGVSRADYVECLDSGRMKEKVTSSIKDGFNSGARSTPYTVLIVGNQQAVISGAQPYTTVKGIIENLISQLEGTFDPTTADAPELPRNESGIPELQ